LNKKYDEHAWSVDLGWNLPLLHLPGKAEENYHKRDSNLTNSKQE
jgi:hypothetical protein